MLDHFFQILLKKLNYVSMKLPGSVLFCNREGQMSMQRSSDKGTCNTDRLVRVVYLKSGFCFLIFLYFHIPISRTSSVSRWIFIGTVLAIFNFVKISLLAGWRYCDFRL